MLQTFNATLTPMVTLFLCIAIGFVLNKLHILPKESGKAISKLILWVFSPALCFITMAKHCTIDTLVAHSSNIFFSFISIIISIILSGLLVNVFAKRDTYERQVYRYALTFSNGGYMGDPLVLAIFGDLILSYYKFYYLPISIFIYTWGLSQLVPSQDTSLGGKIKKLLNPPTVAMLLGIIVGLTGLNNYFPSFLTDTLESLKSCMGPMAMLLAGFTVGNYSLAKMLKNKKIYLASVLRLIFLPIVIVSSLFFIKEFFSAISGVKIDNSFLILAFFASATPLGLNTVVFPESYGQDPEPGAGMTLISHTMCVITIPLMFTLFSLIFEIPAF